MTDDEAATELLKLMKHDDPEADHEEADKLLCELLAQLGYVKTVEVFNNLTKWYA